MNKPTEVLDIFNSYREITDRDIQQILEGRKGEMYDMMRYFMGFADADFNKATVYAGKRFRSGLCLLLADMYGDIDSARSAAASLELFHNFTLIHDDIVDKDELRRGRPTVWKLWGVDHAINSGDAQLVLVSVALSGVIKSNPKRGVELLTFLNEQYLLVHEGQYQDFKMSNCPINDPYNTMEQYYEMIAKKTSVLIGAATKAAGIATKQDEQEIKTLWDFGYNLGMAYQLSDDLVSIWGDVEITGKAACNDLREKKKTLPVMYAYQNLNTKDKEEFSVIYGQKDTLSDTDAKKISNLLDSVGAYEYTRDVVLNHAARAKVAVSKLSVDDEKKELLNTIIDTLLPDVKN